MTVEFEFTKDDLTAFNLYHQYHSPTVRRSYYRAWLLPALAWLLLCSALWYLADKDRDTPLQTFLALLPLFSGVPLYLAYYPWWYRRYVRRIVSGMADEGKNRGLFSRRRVTVSPEGISESDEFVQTSSAWRAVERVVRAPDHAFIYLNALAAIVVPSRAFADLADFDEFVRTIERYHEAAAA
jgi:hypothetical protein